MNNFNGVAGANSRTYVDYSGASVKNPEQKRKAAFSAVLDETLSEEAAGAAAAENHNYHTGHPGAIDYARDYEYTGTQATSGAASPGTDFSAAIADALRDELTRLSVTASSGFSTGLPGGMPVQGQGIEELILSAASTGQVSDAQIALFMLCMMMQTSQDGDFSMLMNMMATMLTQIQGDADKVRNNVMTSDYDPYYLDLIDRNVFNTRFREAGGAGQAVLPVDAWRPTTPVITSDASFRSPQLYRAVIDQFQVETAERYRPGRNDATYCNIFMWDVTRAMGAEIPHYTDRETGEPRFPPDTKGARSMGARAICQWLQTHGETYGWREVDAETAQRYANAGRPAVTSAGERGHVQVVCPSRDGGFDPVRGVTIAQAGRIVTNYSHITSTYSGNGLNDVRYWVHA